jgi:transcriptional regulator with XRE-family HTH domain
MTRRRRGTAHIEIPPDLSNAKLRAVIGRRIRLLRQQKKLSQVQLSKHAGIQPNTLRGIETGAMRSRLKNLARVCGALGTTVGVVAHTLEGATDVWLNPLLKDLVSEDLRIAQRYHHASSDVRFWIDTALKNRERPTNLPAPDLIAFAARCVRLDAFQWQLINLLLKQFEEQAETAAGLRRTRRRRRADRRSSDGTTDPTSVDTNHENVAYTRPSADPATPAPTGRDVA